MERSEIKGYIAKRVSKELNDGDVVNLGIGLPTMVPSFLPEGVSLTLQAENGIIGVGQTPSDEASDPMYITDAGGKSAIAGHGGCYIDSCTSFGLIRGGHVDCTILGALEVDKKGNLANWIIPGKMIPGMGGAMDLVVGAKKVIIAMEHTAKGRHKILNNCHLPLTAVGCVDMIITEMGVIEVAPEGLILKEYNPDFSLEQIQSSTGAPLIISDKLIHMK